MTSAVGEIYSIDTRRGHVAIRIHGLTPKVIRFETDDKDWVHGERVEVLIVRPGETSAPTPIMLEGFNID